MIKCLDRLRHHPVIRCYHKNGYICNLSPARAHLREGLMPRSIKEYYLAVTHIYLISPDVLRNSPRLSGSDIRTANGVKQGGLAMVNVPHNCDYGVTQLQALRRINFL